ncbi:hypothetical protein FAI41_07890 [Acetobacteraceae bacterium]|nr:hypothetical protein FAI41_07890 [Acetobacteraceae bacterium]
MKQQTGEDKPFLPTVSFAWGELSPQDNALLESVFADLEQGKGLIGRISGLMGGSINELMRLGAEGLRLTPGFAEKCQKAAEKTLETAFHVASFGMENKQEEIKSNFISSFGEGNIARGAMAVSGAFGGFGGLPAMLPDLTFSTLVIMREIAAIARQEGEDLSEEGTRRACLEVFGLRSFAQKGGQEEINYFAARALLRGQPLVFLIAEVAGHYGISLSRKTAIQMVPVAGALCGAALNTAFLNHYRALARAHFTVRRLERIYGPAATDAAEMAAAFAGVAPKS